MDTDLALIQYEPVSTHDDGDRVENEVMTTFSTMDTNKTASQRLHARKVRVGPAETNNSSLTPQKNSKSGVPKTNNEYHQMKNSDVADNVCQVFGVFFAIAVRMVLLAFCALTVFLVVDKMQDKRYWSLICIEGLMVVEGVYTIITRKGQERKWICLCFVCYLLGCVPPVWLLELERLQLFENKFSNASTGVSISVSGITAEIVLDSNLALNITEQALVFLLILCRWLLPKGEITRDQLSQLLFVFIGMASDVMELFELFDTTEVRQDRKLTFIILAVWSLSLFQFCLVLTMSHNPKKARIAMDEQEPSEETGAETGGGSKNNRETIKAKSIVDRFFQNEVWSLMVTIFMQDGPFLAVRLYVLIIHSVINYSIVFFTCKNVLVLLLLCYRFLVLCLERMEDDDDEILVSSKGDVANINCKDSKSLGKDHSPS